MKKVSTKISWTRPLWELFFQLTFVSASPASWAVLSLILSKLMSFAHPFMLVYTGTLCSYWADFAAYFAPMTYFDSDTSFYTFVYVFFVLIQLFIALLVYKLYSLWGQLRTNSCPAEYSLSCQTLHVFFLLSAKVLPHISFSAVTYSAYQLLNPGTPFAPYKRLSTWDSVTAQSYVAVVLMLVTSLEILLAGTCFVVFCQDRSVRGVSFWSAGTWYHPMAEIAFILCIKTEFFIDSSVQVGYIIRLLMRLTILIIFALYTKYAHYWIDATEFFFCFLEVELNAFVLMFNMTGWSFDSYASYPVVLIPFGLLACVVRTRVTWRPSLDPPRNEEAAMDSVINLLSLAGSKDYKALTTLTSLLVIHSQRCQIEGCECRTLVIKLVSPSEDSRGLTTEAAMTENTTVYLNENDLPSNITKGAAKEVLTVLIEEFASHASKGEELSTQLAEVDFYYFRNHYSALRQIARVEAGKPRLTVRQRLYNLRRIIAMGFERWEYFEDPEKTLLALEYLRHYHKFLDQIEDSIESTVKFWSIVLEEAPSSSKLSDLGKILFERKYKTTETVGKLSHLASNNIEFLVRYGLFMRLVMHDLIASEQVFQKVVSLNAAIDSTLMGKLAESPFSIFRPDSSVMLIAARLEHTGTATITELNTAVEEVLGYARKDLVGCSVVNLMPPTTAQKHEEYVTKFFRTMKSHNLNIPQARFIKTKEGMYVLCRCLLKFIPKFEKTLQVALFLVPDRRFTCYTSFKHDPTEKRAGAILCVPSTYTVLGFTHEAIGVLRLAEDRVKELLGTFSLFDLFPWMEQKDLMERVFANEGKVIEYRSSRILALNKEAEGGSIDEYVPCSKDDRTLLWARFVVEKVGATSTLISLVVSEVPRDLYKNYAVEEGAEVFYYDARMKTAAMQVLSGDLKLKNCVQHEKVVDEPGKHHGHSPNPARDLNFSDVASVASMNSVGTSTTSSMRKSEGGYEITRELQISSISRQTPTTIKRLAVGIFGMLAAVTTLIVVSAYMSLAEVTRLETRFTLIKEYHNRYKSTMLATDMARIYSCFLIGGSLSSVNRYVRVRNDALSNANEVTRKLLFGQKLTYDEELVGTVDDDYDPITVSFSHALLIYYSSVNSTTTLSTCRNPRRPDVCNYVINMSTYAYNVGYYALREAQDSVSKRLESEVTLLSREGETTQYTITGICLALITASAGVILPIFVWVIKDKSFVIAIFADITHEEATKIIEGTRKIDMKNLHYKRRWIVAAGDGHETFWKKLIAEHHRGFGIGGNIRGLEHERESAVKESSDDLKANLEKVAAEMAEAKDKDEENRAEADEEEAEQIERDKENERIKKEFEEAAKKRKRRHRLSEIDYALRKKFVIRLSCVVFIFYLYGGYSLYFNDYVHNNNSSASSMLFSICKRNVYLHNLNFIVVQALNTKDKVLIGNNVNGTDGKLYAMDIANAMLNIETECKNFEKTASYACYGKYLDQVHLFESSAFCNASDVYSDIASLVGNCTTVYKGPDEYGLSVGISYYINMHIKVSELYLNYNSSDAIQAANVATASDSISRIGFSLTYPLSFALGALMGSFYTCTMNFFDTVRKIVYAASIGFMSVFALVYILVFARFIGMLSEEIWHTRGMLNMIPAEIVENNPGVREQIWRRKGLR